MPDKKRPMEPAKKLEIIRRGMPVIFTSSGKDFILHAYNDTIHIYDIHGNSMGIVNIKYADDYTAYKFLDWFPVDNSINSTSIAKCNHKLSQYHGLTEIYNYCTICGRKESDIAKRG